jgi:hypothetical protein
MIDELKDRPQGGGYNAPKECSILLARSVIHYLV